MCEQLVAAEVLPILQQLTPSDLWHYSQARNRPKFYQKHGIEILGFGSESFVFVDPGDHTKAVAIKYDDRAAFNTHLEHPITCIEAERIRCLHTIFGNLFPDNIPPLLYVQGRDAKDPLQPTGTIRQRIIPVSLEVIPTAPTHPFRQVCSDCTRWGIPLAFDLSNQNLLAGNDGREWYCDMIRYDHLSPYADFRHLGQAQRAIECYMNDHKLPVQKQTVVSQAIRDLYVVLF